MAVRPMDFGGSWYPESADGCEKQIMDFGWREPPADAPRGRFGVAPHAGWVYSGALASRVFSALQPPPDGGLVVVLGGHLRRSDPLVAMCEGEWQTPFGAFTIHGGFRERLKKRFPALRLETPADYRPDNSTELQLPFAKYAFPRAELLPLRVPPGPLALELGVALAGYLAEKAPGAVVVASTDLTHYGPNYGFEPRGRGGEALRWVREVNDPAFIAAVESGQGATVLDSCRKHHNACSGGSVAALCEVARASGGLKFKSLGYATSAEFGARDTANFVGYLGGIFR